MKAGNEKDNVQFLRFVLRHQWERVCLDVCMLDMQVELNIVLSCDFVCFIVNR